MLSIIIEQNKENNSFPHVCAHAFRAKHTNVHKYMTMCRCIHKLVTE